MKLVYSILFFLLLGSVAHSQTEPDFDIPKRLSSNINEEEVEDSKPIWNAKESLLYFVRTFHPDNFGGKFGGQDIWVSKKTGTGFELANNNFPNLNDINNNAVTGISLDGETVYLFSTYVKKEALSRGLSFSTKKDSVWKDPENLKVKKLEIKGDYYDAMVTSDGTVAIFSMMTKTSIGEEDLYVSYFEDGKWSTAANLGPTVNTEKLEMSPFLTNDKQTLYFSSSGHGGLGDVDIFVSKRLDSTWTNWSEPENLGPKLNSPKFDAFFSFYNDRAFFASNREGELSDIYETENLNYFDPTKMMAVKGRYLYGVPPQEPVRMWILEQQSMRIVDSTVTDETGDFAFKRLMKDEDYLFQVNETDEFKLSGNLYLINKQGEMVKSLTPDKDGQFQYQPLTQQQIAGLDPINVGVDYREVTGVLKTRGQSLAGVTVIAKDEYGNEIDRAVTDAGGKFKFTKLDPDTDYDLGLAGLNDTDLGDLGDVSMLLVDNLGNETAMRIGPNGSFKFKTLPADEVAKLEREQADDFKLDLSEFGDAGAGVDYRKLEGALQQDGKALEGVWLEAVDIYGKVADESQTDKNGKFKFTKLSADQEYAIGAREGQDIQLSDADLFLFDDLGNKEKLAANDKGSFEFKTLPMEEVAKLELEQAEDIKLDLAAGLEGQLTTNGVANEGITVQLLDKSSAILEETKTDKKGAFKFFKLPSDGNYSLKLADGQDIDLSQTDLFIVDAVGNKRLVKATAGKFNFKTLPMDATTLAAIDAQDDIKLDFGSDLEGEFATADGPKEGIKMQLLDKDGNVIEEVETDKFGKFKFTKLPADGNYTLQPADGQDISLDESDLFLTDALGNKKALVAKNGKFKFEALPVDDNQLFADDVNDLKLNFEDEIAGQIAVDGEVQEGVDVNLYDENGNIIETVKTDSRGKFKFTKLPPDGNYSFGLSEDNPDLQDADLFLVDTDGRVLASGKASKGKFNYQKLKADAFTQLDMDLAQDVNLDFTEAFGELDMSKLDSVPEGGVMVELVDAEGNVIERVFTDKDGKFKFKKLDPDANYLIRMAGDDVDLMAAGLLDLDLGPTEDELKAEADIDIISKEDKKELAKMEPEPKSAPKEEKVLPGQIAFDLYFGYNQVKLSPTDQLLLRREVLAHTDKNSEIKIKGFTCDIGTATNNQKVANLRAENVAKYLILKEVPETNISEKGIGIDRFAIANPTVENRRKSRRVRIIVDNSASSAAR